MCQVRVAAWQIVCKLGANQEKHSVWSLLRLLWLKYLQYHLTRKLGSNLVNKWPAKDARPGAAIQCYLWCPK